MPSVGANIRMIPSRHDQLDPVARALRWQLDQLAACLPARRRPRYRRDEVLTASAKLPSSLLIELPDEDCFVTEITLPPGSPDAHRKAILLRLAELSPVPVLDVCVSVEAVQRTPQGVTYKVALARKARLANIERQARQRGVSDDMFTSRLPESPPVVSGAAAARDQRGVLINGVLALIVVACGSLAAVSWAARMDRETEAILAAERTLRRAAVAAEAIRREAEVVAQLVNTGVLARRPAAALDAIANVSAVTPDEAWWSMIRWNPDEIIITGESPDATAALQRLSEDALRWRVEPVGAISAGLPGAPQRFEVRLKRREAAP